MQHLGSARFHAGAESGGENDNGYGRLHQFYYGRSAPLEWASPWTDSVHGKAVSC
jgi:hypothetical protein